MTTVLIPARLADWASMRAEQPMRSRRVCKTPAQGRVVSGSGKIHGDLGAPFSGCADQELQGAASGKCLFGS